MARKPNETKVTRISAADDTSAVKKKRPAKQETKKDKTSKVSGFSTTPLGKFVGYFKGAWQELRQVHWPTRGATWGLTGAVLAFALFFVIFITALDAGFKFLFEQILR